jgi:hypothetical protein
MMPDIPYGSSFSIETKWKIKRVDAASCEVTCFVEGNYLKVKKKRKIFEIIFFI